MNAVRPDLAECRRGLLPGVPGREALQEGPEPQIGALDWRVRVGDTRDTGAFMYVCMYIHMYVLDCVQSIHVYTTPV